MTTTATFTVAKRHGGVDAIDDWDIDQLCLGIKKHSTVSVRSAKCKLHPVKTNKVVANIGGVTTHPTLVCTVRFNGHATVKVLTDALEKAAMSNLNYDRIHVKGPEIVGIHRV